MDAESNRGGFGACFLEVSVSYIVKNFEKHQHYKDRRPPWIKLHRTLLDDCAFLRLQPASRALAPLLWLLASEENNGIVKGDVKDIAFRLRLDASEVAEGIKGLLSIDYISCYNDASNTLADCKQEARVETEAEGETEREKETYPPTPKGELFVSDDAPEKKTTRFTPPTPEEVTKFSKSIGHPLDGEAWCNSYEAKGWMIGKSKMKNWKSAVINWKTNGWTTGKQTSSLGGSQPKMTYLPDARTFTCPRCGKKGTLKDTISAQLGGYEDNEHLGQRCCDCYTDPYSGDFNFKIGKGKYPLAQIVELK
jgi:hypothetical protein